MTIHIETLTFETIIGLLDFERDRPQRVIVDLEIRYDYRGENFIDYADVALRIQEKMKKEKYFLLEEALLDLKKMLTEHYREIEHLKLKIAKPDILAECHVALSDDWNF